MNTETASTATEPTASQAVDPNVIEGAVHEVQEAAEVTEGAEAKPEDKPKPEKTPEQREIDRLRRGIDRKTRQLAETRAQLGLTRGQVENNNQVQSNDSESLSLTRAELAAIVKAEAEKLAPTLREQATEVERRQGVVRTFEETWGKLPANDPKEFANRFDEIAAELGDVFDGLQDASGKPKPAIEAIYEADAPKAVIEWLIDPDNADEAERISKLSAVQAGKAIAKLEAKIATEAPKPKAQVSKAPAPLEPVRGQGNTGSGAPDPSNTKAWIAWRNEQERKGF